MDPLFDIPEDIAALSVEALQQFIEATTARLAEVGESPESFITEERSFEALRAEVVEASEALKEARARLEAETEEPAEETTETEEVVESAEETETVEPVEGEEAAETEEPAETAEASEADLEELAAIAVEAAAAKPKPIVAAAAAPVRRRRPARARAAAPQESNPLVPLVASAGADSVPLGYEFGDPIELAKVMIDKDRAFGSNIPDGVHENVGLARADWRELYGEDRTIVGLTEERAAALVASVVDDRVIREAFAKRFKENGGSLTASGGLCAPVTPYYNLQMISVAERPVRAALPAFNADRGGIRAARPASLASITTGVGAMTAAQDAAGGSSGTKTCQTVDCPNFVETDVEILFHCLRFGNLGARTFPERVAQWNNLVLAAHARLGDRTLLSGIDAASTAVTANTLGLGASADLLSQVLTAAAGMRSRHRMDPEAVLRVLFPRWVIDLIVSDVYRTQFQRWDMTPEKFVALLRQGNVEPTFYIDSATGKNQEFGVQGTAALLPFPPTVSWYLYPEGSFLYLDGGTLELGLVRDSVLNSTNDFEIFGESFENVAFIGVESLAVVSTVCDSGITAGTHNITCPTDYTHNS